MRDWVYHQFIDCSMLSVSLKPVSVGCEGRVGVVIEDVTERTLRNLTAHFPLGQPSSLPKLR